MLSSKINAKFNGKPIVFVLASPSAAGKTTLCYEAVKRVNNLWYSVSATTRAKRPNEKNGREYYFLTDAEFDKWLKQEELLESTEIYNARYGTPKTPIIRKLKTGNDVILDLDLNGVKSMKEFFEHTVAIYIIPPSLEELWSRLKHRSKSKTDKLNNRFSEARKEMRYVFNQIAKKNSFIDYIIVNSKLNKAIEDLIAIIRAERLRVMR